MEWLALGIGIDQVASAIRAANTNLPTGTLYAPNKAYTIQTNGTRLDDAWGAFFKEHNFLVGLSVDGPGALHDAYRVDKGGAGSFEYVSAWEVIRGQVERPELLDGAIAIIGATAPGLQDLRSTPFGSIYPGVEIHANVLRGILDGNFRWQPAYSRAAEVLSVAAFGLLMALLLPALSAVWATARPLSLCSPPKVRVHIVSPEASVLIR